MCTFGKAHAYPALAKHKCVWLNQTGDVASEPFRSGIPWLRNMIFDLAHPPVCLPCYARARLALGQPFHLYSCVCVLRDVLQGCGPVAISTNNETLTLLGLFEVHAPIAEKVCTISHLDRPTSIPEVSRKILGSGFRAKWCPNVLGVVLLTVPTPPRPS